MFLTNFFDEFFEDFFDELFDEFLDEFFFPKFFIFGMIFFTYNLLTFASFRIRVSCSFISST